MGPSPNPKEHNVVLVPEAQQGRHPRSQGQLPPLPAQGSRGLSLRCQSTARPGRGGLPGRQGQQRVFPARRWLSRVCVCMSLHAPSPMAQGKPQRWRVAALHVLERQGGWSEVGGLAWASCLLHVCLFGKRLVAL